MTVAARRPALLLAVGVVSLEFAAAVSTFVSATLLPTVARELGARDHLALLLVGSTIGLFIALPLAPAVLARLGPGRTLGTGMLLYVGGAGLAALAPDGWVFAGGRLAGGIGGGLLAVFGVSAVIRHLDGVWRVRVVAASSAMWIVPAFVGPPGTLALEHTVGWRWTLLAPVPVVLVGRLLVLRATRGDLPDRPSRPARGSAARTLLVPVGVAMLVLTSTDGRWWPVTAAGVVLALVGVARIMPPGTARARRGTPAALAGMTLFATGYFGADSLITIMLTDGYGVGVGKAVVVLSAAPLAWATTSLLVPRLVRDGRRPPAALGLGLAAAGVAVLAVGPGGYPTALVSWTVTGVGIGLAYPGLYVLATTPDDELAAEEVATAVITAEAFGGLLGGAAGGAVVSLSLAAGLARADGLALAYGGFAAVLALGALVALRASRPIPAAAP